MRLDRTLLALTLASLPMAAAASTGSGFISGQILDEQGTPIPNAVVVLLNRITGHRQIARTNAKGQFDLFNVPFNDYHLEAKAPDLQTAHRDVDVRSSLPVKINFTLKVAGAVVEVEEQARLLEDHPSAHVDIDRSTIEQIPAVVASRGMENILLTNPGFIQDENGRFHFRGSHGQVMYVVDGVPVTDQVQATFSNSLDPGQVESMEVITGGISAEYGGKPVAVVNLTSKSGLGTPEGFEGEASAGVARFNTFEEGVTVRGSQGKFGYFVTGAGSSSDRFLDPVNFENDHNHGSTGRLFTRFDWLLTDSDSLRFSVSGGSTERDVVNLASQQAGGMDQRVRNNDANGSLGWTHLFSNDRSVEASLFYRHSTARLMPTQDLAPGFQEGGPDFPFWASQDRSLDNQGLTLAYTQKDGGNTIKVGLQYVRYPIHERMGFAITDNAQVSGPNDPLYAYTPAGGGNIFRFDEQIAPALASAFLQDDFKTGNLDLAMGLRLDSYHGRGYVQNQLQPRLGASYALPSSHTLFRIVYDRLLITPENENLAFSTSQASWNLITGSQAPVPRLYGETQDSYLVGIEQQIGSFVRITADYWIKDSTNSADNDQFLNTGILFPISASKGRFHGTDLRVETVPVKGWSGYVSAGTVRTIFYSPTIGGLSSSDPLVNGPAGTPYLIDHDQKLTAQWALRYEHEKFYTEVVGRYDSGLEAGDPTTVVGNPDYAFGIPYVRAENDSLVGLNYRIEPRTIWNWSLGDEFKVADRKALAVGVNLLNVFDRKAVYNFLSTFGGTHVVPPRTLAVHLKFKF